MELQANRRVTLMDKENFEQVQTARAGDRILRRKRKPRGIRHIISRGMKKLFRNPASK